LRSGACSEFYHSWQETSFHNVQWWLSLQFREISEILFAPKLDKQYVHYLQLQISEIVSRFVTLSPEKIIPKVHYLVLNLLPTQHSWIWSITTYVWCMRFEAKHQYFERVANIVHNISYTHLHTAISCDSHSSSVARTFY